MILSVAAVAVLLMVSISAGAQGRVSLGLKGGANSTFFLMDKESPYSNSSLGIGGSAGGFLKYDVNNWFALQTDLMFHYRTSGLKSKVAGGKLKFESYSVELPVYAVFQFDLGAGNIFLGLGPYIGYGLSARVGGSDMFQKNTNGDTPMQRINYGGAIMLGYNFARHWQINASYITQSPLGARGTAAMNVQNFGLGIAYRF